MQTQGEIESKLTSLKELAAQLNKTIADKRAKDYLLRPASDSLSDVESVLLPRALKAAPAHALMWFELAAFQLGQAEKQLAHAREMVSKYGPNLVAVG